MRYNPLLLLALIFASSQLSCARSRGYNSDQDYYNQDPGTKRGSATARADHFGQPRKRLIVLPFVNATPVGGAEFGQFISEELQREIRTAARAIVPESAHATNTSGDFYSGDKVRLGILAREGKRLGVSLLIIGKIKRITYRTKGDDVGLFRQKKAIAAVDLEMRIFDVIESKEVIFDEKSADSSSSQLNIFGGDDTDPSSQRAELVQMALRNAAVVYARDTARAIDKISWEGRIAKITSGAVYINAGRATGLNIGDILKVMTLGEDVYDPLTGAYMGRSHGQPKGTLEIVDYLGTDGAVTVVHSGGNFVENDIVQLY